MPETATWMVWFGLDTSTFQEITSDGFDRWDSSSWDKILLLWNCWYIKMCLVLMSGYNAVKQIVFQCSKNYCFFELAFKIFFSPYGALNSASLHQGILQQLPSCTQALIALSNCSLSIKQHSDLFMPFLCCNSLYTGRISSSEDWATSRTWNCVFRYPDLCISKVVVLAS